MKKVVDEMFYFSEFDYVIINDDFVIVLYDFEVIVIVQ